MESLFVFVGFLGSGKTTLLREAVNSIVNAGYDPYVVLNDYQNAQLDVQWFSEILKSKISTLCFDFCKWDNGSDDE